MVRASASAFQCLSALSTLEVSTMVTVVATIVAVAHAESAVVFTMTVGCTVGTSMIVATSSIHPPAVSTTIGQVEGWTTEVEVGTVRITGVDAEVPVTSLPVEGTVEIAGGHIGTVLPVEEDITQVEIPTSPVDSIQVIITVDAHQVVEVDLISSLILILGEVQFISHLISKEQSLITSLFVTHGID